MHYPVPLLPARLVRRYKRFLADVEMADGEVVTVHCPNPGSMLGLAEPGSDVWLLPAQNRTSKLPFGWELVRADGVLVGINASRPNRLVEEALAEGLVPELAGYSSVRREVRYGTRSRVDLLLEHPGRPPCYVEIKNVHLRRDGLAEFPDSVTARGARHLAELAAMVETGARAVMLYVVQRGDCAAFRLADDLDPGYAAAFADAVARGVEAVCYDCHVGAGGITFRSPLPVLDASPTPRIRAFTG